MYYNYEEASQAMRVLKFTMDDMLAQLTLLPESTQEKFMVGIQALTRSISIIGPLTDNLRIENEEKKTRNLLDEFSKRFCELDFSEKDQVKKMFENM